MHDAGRSGCVLASLATIAVLAALGYGAYRWWVRSTIGEVVQGDGGVAFFRTVEVGIDPEARAARRSKRPRYAAASVPAAEAPPPSDEPQLVLKDEPAATVVVLGSGADAVVQKTYRNRGLRWWQSVGRRSRAHREHDNLAAIHAAGVPSLEPLRWAEARRLGGVDSSTLVTRYLADTRSLKHVLAELHPRTHHRERARLAAAMGALLAALHRAGFLWSTPMPRNVLVAGEPAAARLVVCDTPACVTFRRPLLGSRLAHVDLFLAAFSASRRRDWSATERWRVLLGYAAGHRERARTLWRELAGRSPRRNEFERALAMVAFTYILGPFRRRPEPHAAR